jgi:xanthine dehydrogenase molybdenum-binding subunit
VRFREVLQAALDAAGWKRRKPGPNYGRGVAMFGRHIGGGITGLSLAAEPDGSFTVLSGTFDQGTGIHTILRQLVAEEMRVPVEQVRVMVGDTDTAPYDAGTRATRMTYCAGRAMVQACVELRAQLLARAARILECLPEETNYGDGNFWLREEPSQRVSLRRVVAQANGRLSVTVQENSPQHDDVTYMCAQVAEVEVDPETGEMRVHRFVTAHDVGTIMNPITHQGPIEGGVIMGLGHALMEELVMAGGQVTNASLGDYKLPTVADIPQMETVLVRSDGGLAPYEAKSIGELTNNSPPAAVANAVADAVGVRLFELPITAEKIYHALKEKSR